MRTYIEIIMALYALTFVVRIIKLCANAYPTNREIQQWEAVIDAITAAVFFFWGYSLL